MGQPSRTMRPLLNWRFGAQASCVKMIPSTRSVADYTPAGVRRSIPHHRASSGLVSTRRVLTSDIFNWLSALPGDHELTTPLHS